MLIWGTTGISSVVETGQFHCPHCMESRDFRLKQIRRFFTLYFIPVIPLDIAGRYLECLACKGQFPENMREYDPEQERTGTLDTMLRIMILAALADGRADEAELEEIRRQYAELSSRPLSELRLQTELAQAIASETDLNQYVSMIGDNLSIPGKALVVKLVFFTMSASGDFQPGHQTQLANLADTLGIPEEKFIELIDQLSASDDE